MAATIKVSHKCCAGSCVPPTKQTSRQTRSVSVRCVDMASFAYQQRLGEILKSYAPDIDEGLVSVLGAIGLSSGAIGEHLK